MMARSGGCHCGDVRYEVDGEPVYHAICHCDDCRASSGAPLVAWYCVKEEQFRQTSGDVARFVGKTGSEREFCPHCGTGLFFRNAAVLPGLVDIQSATFDDADAVAPTAQVQCADRLAWVTSIPDMPEFERYPSGG
jgi:hypothetical protein